MSTVYTLGHSCHSLSHFLGLLRQHGIALVVDVRSRPYSRYVPPFNRKALEEALKREGIAYHFLGDKLGGRPENQEFHREDGTIDYGKLQRSPLFQEGIIEVISLAEKFRLALLCGEEDPKRCHRKRLIGPMLKRSGVEVLHIRGDGSIENDENPPGLFG